MGISKSKLETVEFVSISISHSVGKNGIYRHRPTKKCKLYNLSDSIYELNVLIIAFKTGIAQCIMYERSSSC